MALHTGYADVQFNPGTSSFTTLKGKCMEHNVYFDGKMQTLGFQSDKGEATVGVVEPGTYITPTDCVEQLRILSGKRRYKVR